MSYSQSAYESRMKRRAVEQFDAAVREHAFKGSQHPDDWAAIDKKYETAKRKLLARIL